MDADDYIRVYDEQGRLRHESPKGGTGVVRGFAENGQVVQESWLQNGIHVGYVKFFDVDGRTHLFTKFWYNFKYLSKKKYLALCEKHPDWPRFENVETYDFMAADLKRERQREREEAKRLRQKDNSEERQKIEEFCRALLARGRSEEVISWLTQKDRGEITLGELQTNKESLDLARALYKKGAANVSAVEVSTHEAGENSGKLVIDLPADPEARKRLFRWAAQKTRDLGFSPDVDIGQRFIYVALD